MEKQHAFKQQAAQIFWLIGVPLILLAMSLWQWSRAPDAVSSQAQIAQYRAQIQQLDEVQAQNRRSIAFVTDESGKRVAVTLLKSRLEAEIRGLQAGGLRGATAGWQKSLALTALACSVLALAWAGLGLAYRRSMGVRALQSREALLEAFLQGHRLLPVYMVVSVLLLLGATVALLAGELMPLLRHRRVTNADAKAMFAIVIVAGLLLFYGIRVLIDVVRTARHQAGDEPLAVMGHLVTREQVPALWAFVDAVAQRVGAGMPDSIVVGLDEGFFVTEHRVRLENGTDVPPGRVLYLPLPYMAFLNAAEVAAVIGHELSHFVGEDTVYSQRFAPIYAAVVHHTEAVSGGADGDEGWRWVLTRPATVFGELFLSGFHEAVRHWSRKRELVADSVGARVAGAEAVAASLLRITALEPHVSEALAVHWDSGQAAEGGVLGHVRQLVAQKGMADPREHLQERQSHPFDTHPELADRLQAVGVPVVHDALLRRAMDPAGSRLLQDLGLEAAQAGAQQPAVAGATASAAPVDVQGVLQAELTGAAAANRQAKIEELTGMVRQAQAVQPVFERGWWVLLVSAGITALLLLGGFALMRKPGSGFTGACVVAVALAGAAWCVNIVRRRSTPALTLHPRGLQLFQHQDLLPWGGIDDFEFTETNNTFIVRLLLHLDTPVPPLSRWGLRGGYVKTARKSAVTITLLGVGDEDAQQVMDSLLAYWRAHHAREELQRMGVAAA